MKVVPFLSKISILGCKHGYANGCVAVSPKNKFYEMPYRLISEQDLSIHGGLTFSDYATIKEKSFDGLHTYNPKMVGRPFFEKHEIEFLADFKKEIPNDWFIFGFDTCHLGDDMYTCDRSFCINK